MDQLCFRAVITCPANSHIYRPNGVVIGNYCDMTVNVDIINNLLTDQNGNIGCSCDAGYSCQATGVYCGPCQDYKGTIIGFTPQFECRDPLCLNVQCPPPHSVCQQGRCSCTDDWSNPPACDIPPRE